PQSEDRRWDPEDHVAGSKLPVEVRLRQVAAHGIRSAGDGEQRVHAAIEGRVRVGRIGGHEPGFADRPVRGDEGGDRVPSPIEVGDHGLWIRLRYLRAEWGRTGAARGWLRVARGAAIGIERGSQTLAGLDRPGNGIYLLECVQRPTEERLFGSIERRERP